MMLFLSKYLIAILGTLLVLAGITIGLMTWRINSLNNAIDKQNVELGVVAAMSQVQKVKIVESKQIEEKLKVVTQDKLKIITEYVYDNNKSDCDNAAAILSASF